MRKQTINVYINLQTFTDRDKDSKRCRNKFRNKYRNIGTDIDRCKTEM